MLHLKLFFTNVSCKQAVDEGYVFAFSEEKYFYSISKKRCDMHSIKISKHIIIIIFYWKRKKSQFLFLHGGNIPDEYPKKVRTVLNHSKTKMLVARKKIHLRRNQLQSL